MEHIGLSHLSGNVYELNMEPNKKIIQIDYIYSNFKEGFSDSFLKETELEIDFNFKKEVRDGEIVISYTKSYVEWSEGVLDQNRKVIKFDRKFIDMGSNVFSINFKIRNWKGIDYNSTLVVQFK